MVTSLEFPTDLLEYIFTFIPCRANIFSKLEQVSKQFHVIASRDKYWRLIWNRKYPPHPISKNYKHVYVKMQQYILQNKPRTLTQEIKPTLIGAKGVGKTALWLYFRQGVWVEDYDPTIEDSYIKHIHVRDTHFPIIPFEIKADTSSSQQEINNAHLKMHATSFVLLFSLVDEASFVYLSEIIQHIEKLREREISSFPVVLVGTKHDLVTETIISKEQIHSFMARYEIPHYFETDVRRGANVTESFVKIGELICDSTLDLNRKQISQWEQNKKNCQVM